MGDMAQSLGFIFACLVVFVALPAAQAVCSDLDPVACQSIPGVCSDTIMAESACPKFCKLCPLVCYQCTSTFDDQHLCNTTKTCAKGEVCMKKIVTSVVDGHHEYQLSCEPQNHCDGRNLTLSFGKRALGVRDLSVSCCFEDMCNSASGATTVAATLAHTDTTPPPTAPTHTTTRATQPITTKAPPTTTATHPPTTHVQTSTPHAVTHAPSTGSCKKDIVILLEDSDRHTDVVHAANIKAFLSDIVSHLAIGPQAALMSVTKFTERYRTVWELDTYPDKTSLSSAIQQLRLFHDHDHTELETALSFALHHETSSGHRPDAGDVVIIITDDKGGNDAQRLAPEMSRHFNDVIEIVIDDDIGTPDGDFVHVGSDTHHEFAMNDSRKLHRILAQVIYLICQ